MAIIVYHGGSGTYFELTDDVYIAEIKDGLEDESEIQTAAIVDGFPLSSDTAREIYELAMNNYEQGT
jgi:hypothetical protein